MKNDLKPQEDPLLDQTFLISDDLQTAFVTMLTLTRAPSSHLSALPTPTSVYKTLSVWQPSLGSDHEYWWRSTGRRLAIMLKEAGYSLERQYEILMFHYHWLVPNMGPRPRADGSLHWTAPMTFDGTPVYYCWKWNSAGGVPEVRLTIDVIGKYANTPLDPINILAPQELLYKVSQVDPAVDSTLTRYLIEAYYEHAKVKEYVKNLEEGQQNLPSGAVLCFEFGQKGKLGVKTYLAPLKNHDQDADASASAIRDAFEGPIRALYSSSTSLEVVTQFLENSPVGKLMRPVLMAPDNVSPSSAAARMKYYFFCPRTSFDSVREVMTLGGRITNIDKQLEHFKQLIKAITPLPEDFPDDAEIYASVKSWEEYSPEKRMARKTLYQPGYLYYFDVAPSDGGSEMAVVPDIKWYGSLRTYRSDDYTRAKGLTSWMKAQGRGMYCENYMRMLEGIAGTKGLHEYDTLHAYVSFMIKKNGEMDVTSYMMPDRDFV